MNIPDGQLIRKAFLTKYGYALDLTYEEIVIEFQTRYDHAQALRLTNCGLHRSMLVIEGMAESSANEEASFERQVRKFKIERLAVESGYGITELDQLVEGLAARLETEWIQKI